MARAFPSVSRRDIVFAAIVVCVTIADQLIKAWIRSSLAVGGVLFDAGFFRIIHLQNTGAAFGLFKGIPYVFVAIEVLVIIAILYLVFFRSRHWAFLDLWTVRVGAALVMAGTIGNFVDRVFFSGNVTDFLDFKVWPVFNLADSSAVVGAIIIGIAVVFQFRPAEPS